METDGDADADDLDAELTDKAGIIIREIDCPSCGSTFYAKALAAPVDVEVYHERDLRGGKTIRLEEGETKEFRWDGPSLTRVSVTRRESPADVDDEESDVR